MTKLMLVVLCAAPMAWADARVDELVPVTFAVSSAPKATLLSGQVVLQTGKPVSVERHAARSEKQSLVLEAKPLEDGKVLVRAWWNDSTAEGETVRWEPSFIVKRGGEATVRLEYPGGVRLLTLTAG